MYCHSSYLNKILDPETLVSTVDRICELLCTYFPEANAIAVTGLSGELIVGAVSYKSGLPIIAVRKALTPHSQSMVEYNETILYEGNYVIIDDMVCTGETVQTIIEEIEKVNPKLVCVGLILHFDAGEVEFKTWKNSLGEIHKVAYVNSWSSK